MLRFALAAAVLLAATLTGSARLNAQQPGDVYWQIVPNGILADQRIQYALVLLTDTEAAASAAGLGGTILYANPEFAEFLAQIDQPREEATLLLMAAGFDDPGSQLTETRRCRFWTPSDATSLEALSHAGAGLAEALADAWARLGVEIEPCEATTDREAADILLWESGQDYAIPENVYYFDADSYLSADLDLLGAVPGGTGGGEVSPPTTGNAGLR